MDTIEIVIENTHERRQVRPGISLAELAQEYYTELGRMPLENPILGGLVNNKVEHMQFRLYSPKTVYFFDIHHPHGWRMYQSSLTFMLYKAVRDIYPDARLSVKHSMQGGFYCTIEGIDEERITIARTVRDRMIELQHLDLPFQHRSMLLTDAIEHIKTCNIPKTLDLLQSLNQLYITMHVLDGTMHKMASKLVPSTGCLKYWDFHMYADEGYILQMPDPHHIDRPPLLPDTPKLFNIFREHHEWVDLLHTPTVGDYNRIVYNGGGQELILLAEALHEKKYAEIADQVRQSGARMVLLAGPSSSGKTTSCRRLSVQLSVLGYDVKQLSLDDYFMCRERTPKLPNGEYDFESIDALDIPLLNEHLNALFHGEEVKIPTFDFLKGEPFYSGKTLKLGPNSILVVEGIHALNPKLTAEIDEGLKYKVYVSALTQLAIDKQNIIHGTDNRLVRRIVRDNNFRGWNAYETLRRWPEVVRGERKHIFPYQENANVMFNSALLYELGVLKRYAEPLLKQVPKDCEEYSIAQQLLGFSELLLPIEDKFIPYNSIMREFLGGSAFEY